MSGPKNRRSVGFTVVELLVCVVVIAALLALSFPALKASRAAARELRCVSNGRQGMQLVHMYTLQARDSFPTWMGDGPEVALNQRAWKQYSLQGFTVMHKRGWLNFTGLTMAARTMRCPANQLLALDPSGETVNFDYSLADSLFIEPAYLSPDLSTEAWVGRLGGRVQKISDVRWPDAKAGLFEKDVWHGWPGVYGPGIDLINLQYYQSTRPGTVAFLDGHAGLFRPKGPPWVRRYPTWPYSPYGMTAWGILGRDR